MKTNHRILQSLLLAVFSLTSSVVANESSSPSPLENQVRRFLSFTDTRPPKGLRESLLSREDELKPILTELMDEAIINGELEPYSQAYAVAALAAGLEDKEFAADIWRTAAFKFKDYKADAGAFYRDYAKFDPDGAEDTFTELAKIGNEDVRAISIEFLEKIRKGESGRSNKHLLGGTTSSSRSDSSNESNFESRRGQGVLMILGLIGVLGVITVWLRYRKRIAKS